MKRIIYFTIAVMTLCLTACGDDDEARGITPTATGTVCDDDGNEYSWVRIGNLDWTTSNAKNGPYMGDITYYEDVWGYDYIFSESELEYIDDTYIPAHGNIMSYEDALKSAPDGWRLPTDEDWQNLERELGMKNAGDMGWRGTTQGELLMQKDSGSYLGLTLGGGIMKISLDITAANIQLAYEKERGYYWTATPGEIVNNLETAYIRKVVFGVGQVNRICIETKDRYCSVRWVRDAK